MPTYEYTCEACSAGWEQEQRMADDPIKVCPKCGAPKAKRLISGGNFMLKGDGWYKDLYHKPAAKKASGDSASSSSESKPAASSESKPAASSSSSDSKPSSGSGGSSSS